MDNPDAIRDVYNDLVSILSGKNQYNYGFIIPSKQDTLLPLDKAVQNHIDLAHYENSFQGYLYFYQPQGSSVNLDENTYDDYMTLASAAGAVNFLAANGFSQALDKDIMSSPSDFIKILTTQKNPQGYGITYPFQPSFLAPLIYTSNRSITMSTTMSTTMPPRMPTTMPPTMPPTMPTTMPPRMPTTIPPNYTYPPSMPTCSPCKKEKLTTKKEAYFSLLGALVFLLLSLPIVYRLTDVVFGSIGANTMSENGAPTYFGLFLHFVVYFLIIFGIMKLFEKKN